MADTLPPTLIYKYDGAQHHVWLESTSFQCFRIMSSQSLMVFGRRWFRGSVWLWQGWRGRNAVKHPISRDPRFSTDKDLILNANSDQVEKSCLILSILALGRLRQKDYGFKASLSCMRPCLKNKANEQKQTKRNPRNLLFQPSEMRKIDILLVSP